MLFVPSCYHSRRDHDEPGGARGTLIEPSALTYARQSVPDGELPGMRRGVPVMKGTTNGTTS